MQIKTDQNLENIKRGLNNPGVKRTAHYSMDLLGQQIGNIMSRFLSEKDYTGVLSTSVEGKLKCLK